MLHLVGEILTCGLQLAIEALIRAGSIADRTSTVSCSSKSGVRQPLEVRLSMICLISRVLSFDLASNCVCVCVCVYVCVCVCGWVYAWVSGCGV